MTTRAALTRSVRLARVSDARWTLYKALAASLQFVERGDMEAADIMIEEVNEARDTWRRAKGEANEAR